MSPIKLATSNRSSDKLLKIMEFLAMKEKPLALRDIAIPLNMSKSTVLRYLTTLSNNGYLAQEPGTGNYYLTYRLVALGRQIQEKQKLSMVTESYLKEMAHLIGETVCFAIPQDEKAVYIGVVEAPEKELKGIQRIGNIAPSHASCVGKVFLAALSDEKLDEMLEHEVFTKFTEYTITDKEALIHEVEKIRNLGYGTNLEESELGMASISLPVYGYGEDIVAALNIIGPKIRIDDAFIEKWLPYLKNASAKITKLLGY